MGNGKYRQGLLDSGLHGAIGLALGDAQEHKDLLQAVLFAHTRKEPHHKSAVKGHQRHLPAGGCAGTQTTLFTGRRTCLRGKSAGKEVEEWGHVPAGAMCCWPSGRFSSSMPCSGRLGSCD